MFGEKPSVQAGGLGVMTFLELILVIEMNEEKRTIL